MNTEVDLIAEKAASQYVNTAEDKARYKLIFKASIKAIRTKDDNAFIQLMDLMEAENTEQMSAVDLSEAYCKRGCSQCCSRTVMATIPEAIRLWAFTQTLSSQRKVEVMKKATARNDLTDGIPPQDYQHINFQCPHLEVDGACGAYKGRPIICRNYYSKDLKICIDPIGLAPAEYEKNIIQAPFKIGFLLQKAFIDAWTYLGFPNIILTIEKTLVIGAAAAKANMNFVDYLLTQHEA